VFDAAAAVDVPPQGRGLGMVFQSYAIWPHLSVLDNVMLPLTRGHRRLRHEAARAAALQALEMVGIASLADRPAPLLSGGQQQRVALARALAVSSDVLLMDEPLSNLDAQLRDEVRRELKALVGRLGATVLYVTHDRAEAMALGERLLVIDQGAVVQAGPPDQVYRRPATRQLAEFLGHVNWLDGTAQEAGRIDTPLGPLWTARCATPPSHPVTVGIRPESLSLHPISDSAGAVNHITATAVSVQFLGSHAVVEVECGGRRLVAESRGGDILPAAGEAVSLHLPPEQLLVFERGGGERLLSGTETAAAASG
jgi:iron(III) transport system ATP-binding protein